MPVSPASPHIGISYCRIEDRTIFLDAAQDRYFCLTPAHESAWQRLLADKHDEADLAALTVTGLVAGTSLNAAPASPIPLAATRCLLDGPLRRPALGQVLAALWALRSARRELRVRGLASSLDRLAHRKAALARPSALAHKPGTGSGLGTEALLGVGAAFAGAARFATMLDLCLPASLSTAHRLISLGFSPDLVIGVRLAPFRAHAWVQCEDVLVNEHCEVAATFTPVLVL